MSTPALECRAVTKSYGERLVLQSVSLQVRPGERLALTGPSGSGKTTLLNCMGGIDRPDSGEILLAGAALSRMNGRELAEARRRTLGTVFQFFHLLPTLTVRENVEFPLMLLGVASDRRREQALALLERVHVAHRADALPSMLSGGEMQRTAVARALIHRPAVLLADEPTGNLDSVNGANLLELLRALSEETGTAIVLVTHSAEAAAICHRVLHMRDGQLQPEGP